MTGFGLLDHERLTAQLAREEGFEAISLSSEVNPRIKILPRVTSVCTDAYLSPIVRAYVNGFLDGFEIPPQRVDFIASDGGLRKAQMYSGNTALLSGPAGGVVGVARSCYDIEDRRALIGFDMACPEVHPVRDRILIVFRVVPAPMSLDMMESSITSWSQQLQAARSPRPC